MLVLKFNNNMKGHTHTLLSFDKPEKPESSNIERVEAKRS
jgi:hypothetical protein